MRIGIAIVACALASSVCGAPETINGLGDLAGQKNDFWNTTARVGTVVDVASGQMTVAYSSGCSSSDVVANSLDARDANIVSAILDFLSFKDPSGFMMLLR